MKKIILLLLIATLAACNTAEKQTSVAVEPADVPSVAVPAEPEIDPKYLITSGAVDIFREGEKIPTEVAGYKITKKDEITGQAVRYTAYTIWENDEAILRIENFANNKPMIADYIYILSNKFKTSKNIGLGSTIEEFVAAYPDYELGTTVEDDMANIRTGQLDGVGFFIDNDDILTWPEDSGYVIPLKPSNFKKGAKIIEISV